MSHREDLWTVLEIARNLPHLGSFLERLLADRIIGSVFLLHREELFQRNYFREEGITISLGTNGLPLMSHRVPELRTSMERHAQKVTDYVPRWLRTDAEGLYAKVEDAVGDRPIDALVIAVLNTIRQNADLRELVNGEDRVTQPTLRRKIKSYESLSFDGVEEDWAKAAHVVMGGHGGRTMRDVFLHADLLKGIIDVERFRFALLERTILHWERLLPARRVKDIEWRRILLELHQTGLVEHIGPLCLWCNRCGETGVTANVATSYVLHPVYCPRCRNTAHAITTFAPIPQLRRVLELHDGALGAAIGWWLAKHGIEFRPSEAVGGYEIDYVVSVSGGAVMVECKMNHVLETQELVGKLYENRNQLRCHLVAARRAGYNIVGAACVVNLPATELGRHVASMKPEAEAAFTDAGAKLLSYEEALDWLNGMIKAKRNGQLPG